MYIYVAGVYIYTHMHFSTQLYMYASCIHACMQVDHAPATLCRKDECLFAEKGCLLLHGGFCGVRRTVLLLLLMTAAGINYIIENPSNSLLALHDRYIWFLRLLQARGVTVTKLSLIMSS